MPKQLSLIAALFALLLTSQLTVADDSRKNNFSIGFTSSEISNDEAGAVSLASPLINDLFQLKFSLAQAYKDGIKIGQSNNAWYGYQVYNLGVAVVVREHPNLGRVYVEGGLNYIKPTTELSSLDSKVGRYWLVGTELYLNPDSWLDCCSAYMEFGSTGKGIKADGLIGNPTVGHGFVSTVGLRVYF